MRTVGSREFLGIADDDGGSFSRPSFRSFSGRMSPVFLPSDSLIVSPNYASYSTDYGEESNRQIESYPSTRIPELSRSVIEVQVRKISEAKSEAAIYEPLCSILNQACLDLAGRDDKTVLVFIVNSTRKRLQTMPDLVGFFVARAIAEKILSGELERGHADWAEVPSVQELICIVERKSKTDAERPCKRHLLVLSRHRPASSTQYGFTVNRKMVRLIGLGLDEEFFWPEVEWTERDCIEKLYGLLTLVLDEAKKPIESLVPKLHRVIGWKNHTIGLYAVSVGDRQFLLSEIFAGRGNGRKTFVAVGAEKGKPEEARLFKYSWWKPGQPNRERRILEKLVGVPGVVQIDSDLSREAIATDQENGRQRNLLVLKTVGFSLTSCESIRAFLEAMYDLLEGEQPIIG